MPIDYRNYPPDWKSHIRPTALARAGHRCEVCGVKNYAAIDDEYKVIRIVLTISHTDHDITNNHPDNLRALCQRCHLNHDRAYHKKMRQINRCKKKMVKGQLAFDLGEEATWE